MFQVFAIIASLALAQAGHPLGYGLDYHGLPHSAAIPAVNHPGAPVVKTGHALGYGLGYGHGYGYHHDYKQPFLSCFEEGKGFGNSISVNIKPRMYGYGLAGFGAGHMGLEATINVFSRHGGEAVISFTEKANALGSGKCIGADYGNYLGLSQSDYDDSVADHKYGPGFGGYGGYGFGYGYGHGKYEVVAPSVAKTKIAPNMMATFHIDHLEGFTSLAQLAGRGVMVCAKDKVKSDSHGHWYCDNDGTDTAFPCCNLHFSGSGDSLDAGGKRHGDTSASQGEASSKPEAPTLRTSTKLGKELRKGTKVTLTSVTTSSGDTIIYRFYKNGSLVQSRETSTLKITANSDATYTSDVVISGKKSDESNPVTIIIEK